MFKLISNLYFKLKSKYINLKLILFNLYEAINLTYGTYYNFKMKIINFFKKIYRINLWIKNILVNLFFLINRYFFYFNIGYGISVIILRIRSDIKKFFKFWLNIFKSFFIKGKRFFRWCELIFFLLFPFIHFGLFVLFIYKYIIIYLFLVLDILTVYVLMDIKKITLILVEFFLKKMPEVHTKHNNMLIKRDFPNMHRLIIKKEIGLTFDYIIDITIKIKRFVFLIFFHSIFTYIPMYFKKSLYYISFDFWWYVFCKIQNRIDLFLYERAMRFLARWPYFGLRTKRRLRTLYYIFLHYKWKIQSITIRSIRIQLHHTRILYASKIGFKMHVFAAKTYGLGFCRYRLSVWRIRFFHIYSYISFPFRSLYHKVSLSYLKLMYYDLKLAFCFNEWLNIPLYFSSLKMFRLIIYHPLVMVITYIRALPKRIYYFCKLWINELLLFLFLKIKKISKEFLLKIKNFWVIKEFLLIINIFWFVQSYNCAHSKTCLRIRKFLNFMNIKKKEKK